MKVNRNRAELIARLKDHCAILEDFHQKACREGQIRYLGEIAGKLRVLVHASRTNRPLLLDLMKDTGITVAIPSDSPRGRHESDLPTYLAGLACAIRVPTGEMAQLSKSDVIALWSQQSGASHEDWALDQRLATIFAGGLSVNEQPIHGAALCGICRTVLYVARRFVAQVEGAA